MYRRTTMTFLAASMQRTVSCIAPGSLRTLSTAETPAKATFRPYKVDFSSLQAFAALQGHVNVPKQFTLSPDIPGVGKKVSRLGKHVDQLRTVEKTHPHRILPQDREMLNQMGFVWDIVKEKFDLLVEGIVTYSKLKGDILVPGKFIVPDQDKRWPEKLWNFALGQGYFSLRKAANLPSWQAKVLKEKGIPLAANRAIRAEYIMAALEGYKQYMKIKPGQEFMIPYNFRVPRDDMRWDPALWGGRLGMIIHNHHYAAYHERFHQVGLRFDPNIDVKAERLLAALQAYEENIGEEPDEGLKVGTKFTVPRSPNWDPSLWGMKLGYMLLGVKYNNFYSDYHDKFRETGLYLDKDYGDLPERILAALKAYRVNMNISPGQEFTVPANFKVPSTASWDPTLAGLQLGRLVQHIRYGRAYADYHEKFRSVGLRVDKGRILKASVGLQQSPTVKQEST